MNEEIVVIQSVSDYLEAEILRSLLESRGIRVVLSRESASTAIGLTVGPLAEVDLLVPKSQMEEAKNILNDYYKGNLEMDN
jgi:hypothetical protein